MYREAGGSDRSMSGAVCRREVGCDGDTDDRVCKKRGPLYIQGVAMCGMSNVSAG